MFYPEELESNLMNLISAKALDFIKQETRKATKIIIKKRFKWMNKIKKEISKTSLENMWEFTMGNTALKIDEYIPKKKELIRKANIKDNKNSNDKNKHHTSSIHRNPRKRKRMS